MAGCDWDDSRFTQGRRLSSGAPFRRSLKDARLIATNAAPIRYGKATRQRKGRSWRTARQIASYLGCGRRGGALYEERSDRRARTDSFVFMLRRGRGSLYGKSGDSAGLNRHSTIGLTGAIGNALGPRRRVLMTRPASKLEVCAHLVWHGEGEDLVVAEIALDLAIAGAPEHHAIHNRRTVNHGTVALIRPEYLSG